MPFHVSSTCFTEKCQSASADMAVISLIINCFGDKSAPFAGLSSKPIIQIDHPDGEKKKNHTIFFLYLGGISCTSVCVSCPVSFFCPWARRVWLHPFVSPSPQVFFKVDMFPCEPSLLQAEQSHLSLPLSLDLAQSLNQQHQAQPIRSPCTAGVSQMLC